MEDSKQLEMQSPYKWVLLLNYVSVLCRCSGAGERCVCYIFPWASEPWWDEGCSQGMLFMEYSPCVVYYRLSYGLYSRICAVGV